MIILIVASISSCIAQDIPGSFLSAYKESTHPNYSVQWSVGHLITETFVIGDITLGSGLSQQAPVITQIGEEAGSGIVVFPNPFRNTLVVESTTVALTESTITLHSMLGVSQNVAFASITNDKAQITADDLPAGVYILTVKDNRTSQTKKIKVVRK
jgi:hypothetical protein